MLLRTLLLAGSLVIGIVIDSAWLSRLPLRAGPDLLLLIVLATGLRLGLEAGTLAGAAAGYLRDLSGGGPMGMFALAYLAIGAAAGAASPMVDLQQRAMPAAAAVVATAALALVGAAIVAATGVAPVVWPWLLGDGLIAIAWNALLAGWVDGLVRGIDRAAQRRYAGRVIGHRVLR